MALSRYVTPLLAGVLVLWLYGCFTSVLHISRTKTTMHLDAPDQLSVQQTIKKGSSEAQPPEEEDEDMKYFMYDPNVAEIARIIRRPRPPKYPIPKILPPGRSEMGYMLGLYSGEDPDIVIDPNTAVDPAANVARTSSKKKVSVKDLCAKPKAVTYTCVPGENGAVAYVYFLNNSTGYAVPRRGRDPDDNHTYFQYTYAAISQLQSLTTLPIVLLVTSGVPKVQREKFLAIGNNVQVRDVTCVVVSSLGGIGYCSQCKARASDVTMYFLCTGALTCPVMIFGSSNDVVVQDHLRVGNRRPRCKRRIVRL